MKKVLLIFSLLGMHFAYSQENGQLKIKDEWFREYGSKGLQVGDTMPDISLGTVINNYTGKTLFSEFKGKLIILDFWGTSCTTCIENFPYMEKLQQEFGDKIQIFLVNPLETQQQIEERLAKYRKKVQLPNLPSIVADRLYTTTEDFMSSCSFYKLLPFRTVPHHVWIDEKGIIRLRGGERNTYPEKIRDLLAGKDIFVLNNSATLPSLAVDRNMPYYKQLANLKSTPVAYGSFITPYNNELDGGWFTPREIVDSLNNDRITYFFNKDLLDMYMWSALNSKSLIEFGQSVIYSPAVWGIDLMIFPKDIDTLKYSSEHFFVESRLTDKEYIKSKYCYEQIVPLDLPDEKKRQYVLQDLNRYFAQHYRIVAELERRNTFCYELVRTSGLDKVASKAKDLNYSRESNFRENGKMKRKYEFSELKLVIDNTIRHNIILNSLLIQNKNKSLPFLLINETGWEGKKRVDMVLPTEGLNTINDLRNVLKLYDLDIIEKERELEFLVFKKVE